MSIQEFSNRLAALKTADVGAITNTLSPEDWNDEKFNVYWGAARTWLNARVDLDNACKWCMHYIACYFGVAPCTHDDVTAQYKSILPYLNLVDSAYVFHSSGTTTSNPPNYNHEFRWREINFGTAGKSVAYDQGVFTHKECRAFYDQMKALSEATVESKNLLVKVTTFLMLNMFRTTRRETDTLFIHMPTSASKSFQSLISPESYIRLPPPSGKYIEMVREWCTAYSTNSRMVSAILVKAWIRNSSHPIVIGFLKAGCMLALNENGLGGISWPLKAAIKHKIEIGDMLAKMCLDTILTNQVRSVFTFLSGHDKGKTWPFCRLFSENALCNYSTKSLPNLAVLGALIALDEPDMLRDMAQFKDHKIIIDSYIIYADAVLETIAPTNVPNPKTNQAQEVVNKLNLKKGRITRLNMSRRKNLRGTRQPDEDYEAPSEPEQEGESDEDPGSDIPNIHPLD